MQGGQDELSGVGGLQADDEWLAFAPFQVEVGQHAVVAHVLVGIVGVGLRAAQAFVEDFPASGQDMCQGQVGQVLGGGILHGDGCHEVRALPEGVDGERLAVHVRVGYLETDAPRLLGQVVFDGLHAGDEGHVQRAFTPVLHTDGALAGGGQVVDAGGLARYDFGLGLPVQCPTVVQGAGRLFGQSGHGHQGEGCGLGAEA